MTLLTWLGFAAAALAYGATLLLVSTVAQKKSVHKALMLALGGGLIWSLTLLVARFYLVFDTYIFIAESIRLLTLLIFLKTILSVNNGKTSRGFWRPFFVIITLTLLFAPLANNFALVSKAIIFVSYLSITVIALVLLEILFRHAKQEMWAIKPMLLGLGTLLIFDFINFANASLVQQVDQNMWLARGYLHSVFVPLLLISVKRTKALQIKVFVSRDMVFQSSILLASGGYLLMMAAVGYYINTLEQKWSHLVQILFLVLGFAFLTLLFISDNIKRKFKVFIEKHFFANRFDYRERWLMLTQLLSAPLKPNETMYLRALTGFMKSIDYDQGAIVKLNHDNLEFKANCGIHFDKVTTELLKQQLVPYIKQKNWLLDIHEYRRSVQHYPGLVIPHSIASLVKFQVIVPIYQEEQLWGVALLNSSNGSLKFNWELRDYMRVVSMQLGGYVLQFEANQQLTENAQFAAFNRTSAFVVHDLKNVLAQIRMILTNAQKHKHNPEFIDDTFETLQHTDARMQKMLDQLMSKQPDASLQQQFSVSQLVRSEVLVKTEKHQPKVTLTTQQDFELTIDSDRFASVIYHLLDNAQQATGNDGFVGIDISTEQNYGLITISDNGCGMSQRFIDEQLFVPFVTTKGNAGMGIGAYDAKQFIQSLGGKIEVSSELEQGSTFVIYLPLS